MDPRRDTGSQDRAARRYWTLQFLRLAGILLTLLGAMMVVGRIESDGLFGPILFVLGPLLFFVLPIALVRRWKSGSA